MHILDMTNEKLTQWIVNNGFPKFRAQQLKSWLYQSRVESFPEMSNLPRDLQELLEKELTIWSIQKTKHQVAEDGTEKLLLDLEDGGQVESVLIRQKQRRTICISTQVGCAMGCVFCASGLDGMMRNLTRGEIIEQMLLLTRLLPPEERISHIVVMGMGEPMANLGNLLSALDVASSQDGLGISYRRMTISTVGLPKAMARLAQTNPRIPLALSLHAPTDELRGEIVPANKSAGLTEVMKAADQYFQVSGRRVTYEYVLLGGKNDQPVHARQLARLLKNRTALVNLIPYNPVEGLPYKTPKEDVVERFCAILEEQCVNVKVRRRKGDKINAACGQLRRTSKHPDEQ